MSPALSKLGAGADSANQISWGQPVAPPQSQQGYTVPRDLEYSLKGRDLPVGEKPPEEDLSAAAWSQRSKGV